MSDRLPLTQGRIKPVDAVGPDTTPAVLFASHGSYGVADLGASKTVILGGPPCLVNG